MCFGGGGSSAPAPRRYEPYASPNVDPVAKQQQEMAQTDTSPNASSPTTTSQDTGLSIK